jgi:hypothetical protein
MARKFFYVSLGILALACAYHLGAKNTQAQGGQVVAALVQTVGSGFGAVTPSGDVYDVQIMGGQVVGYPIGNIFTGPTNVEPSSFGTIKGKFKN